MSIFINTYFNIKNNGILIGNTVWPVLLNQIGNQREDKMVDAW